jgi:hypothetical protein
MPVLTLGRRGQNVDGNITVRTNNDIGKMWKEVVVVEFVGLPREIMETPVIISGFRAENQTHVLPNTMQE